MVEKVALELAGVKVVLISTGAAILSIHTPDRNGDLDDIVLGHPTVEDYAVWSCQLRERWLDSIPTHEICAGRSWNSSHRMEIRL